MLIYAGEVKLRCIKVKTRAVLEAERADNGIIEHLNSIKHIQINRKKKSTHKKMSSSTFMR